MRCADVRDQLSAFLDGELASSKAGQIQAHLDSCPPCRAEADLLERTIRTVKELPVVEAPSELREGVLARIEAEGSEAKAPTRRAPWRALWPAAAAIIIAVVIARLVPGRRFAQTPGAAPTAVDSKKDRSFAAMEKADVEGKAGLRGQAEAAFRSAHPEEEDASRLADRDVGRADATPKAVAEAPTPSAPARVRSRGKKSKGAPADEERLGLAKARSLQFKDDAKGGHFAVEEITILSEDPRSAFRRTVNFANTNSWITREELARALESEAKAKQPISQVILFLTHEETIELRNDLHAAGLDPIEVTRQEATQRAGGVQQKQKEAEKPLRGKMEAREEAKAQADQAVTISNRAVMPEVQTLKEQNVIRDQVRQAKPALNQINVNFRQAPARAKEADADEPPEQPGPAEK